ncbi:ankyrin repeat-containing domain, PGG domain protein [Tanacetum coccineum]
MFVNNVKVSAHKPVEVRHHSQANGQAQVANREIVKGIEKQMKEYKTCWVNNAKVEHMQKALQFVVNHLLFGPNHKVSAHKPVGARHHSQANGQAQVTNREIMKGVKKQMKKYKTCWVDELSSVLWAHRTTPKVSAHKPVGAGLHSQANGQAEVANREIMKGVEKRMKEYKTCWVDELSIYLFDKSNGLRDHGWDAKNRPWLLQKCVEGDMFDHRELASDAEVLRILAKNPDVFVKKSSNFLWKPVNWVFAVFAFVCPKEGHPKKDTEALELLRIIWKDIAKKPKKEIDDMIRGPADKIKKDDRLPYGKEDQHQHLLKLIADHVIKIPTELQKIKCGSANISRTLSKTKSIPLTPSKKTYSSRTLFIAAEMGNTKFIVELIRQYPDLIWKVNDNNQTIFHIAVKHHHEVGKSAKRKRLQDVSGVAFQMQRELLWFREVESMIPPSYRERNKKDGLTPHELFTKEHNDLVVKGEEWMKGTTNQCMVVGALIVTVVFAAAFTVLGGYNQTSGIPVFKTEATFMAFVVADAISLFSSAASILMFLSILTSYYAERDFLQSLSKKLMLVEMVANPYQPVWCDASLPICSTDMSSLGRYISLNIWFHIPL